MKTEGASGSDRLPDVWRHTEECTGELENKKKMNSINVKFCE